MSPGTAAEFTKLLANFRHADAELVPQPSLQSAVVLRAAEHIANQFAKSRRTIQHCTMRVVIAAPRNVPRKAFAPVLPQIPDLPRTPRADVSG